MPTMEISVSDEQVASFRENGFLAIDRISPPEEISWLRDAYDEVMANPAALRLLYEGEVPDGRVINQVFLPDMLRPEMNDTHYMNNAHRLAARLLGVAESDVQRGGLMLIHKPPTGGREAPWHHDEAYWAEYSHVKCNSLSVWMPLDDVVVESGAMQFIPGSHTQDVRPHRKLPGDPLVLDEPLDTSVAVACPMSAGGATLHHCRTLHHTAANTSGRPRRAMTSIFHGPAEPRPEPFPKPWLEPGPA